MQRKALRNTDQRSSESHHSGFVATGETSLALPPCCIYRKLSAAAHVLIECALSERALAPKLRRFLARHAAYISLSRFNMLLDSKRTAMNDGSVTSRRYSSDEEQYEWRSVRRMGDADCPSSGGSGQWRSIRGICSVWEECCPLRTHVWRRAALQRAVRS